MSTTEYILDALQRHATHPSSYLATNRETLHFIRDGIDGFIAYRPAGRGYLICVAGVTAPAEQREPLLKSLLEMARGESRRVIAVQLLKEDAELFTRCGFCVNQIGASYAITLDRFKITGTPFIRLRNKISKARRSGVEVFEVGVELPATETLGRDLHSVDDEWLRGKGRFKKELKFLVGELGDVMQLDRSLRRVFVAMSAGEVLCYILYTRCYGTYGGWMHDLSRRKLAVPPGVMELVNYTAIQRFQQEGVVVLNFGFTPLTGLDNVNEYPAHYSAKVAWVFRKLAVHGAAIYPAQSQVQYKLKWLPDIVLPEYIAFQEKFSFGGLWQFLRITQAV